MISVSIAMELFYVQSIDFLLSDNKHIEYRSLSSITTCFTVRTHTNTYTRKTQFFQLFLWNFPIELLSLDSFLFQHFQKQNQNQYQYRFSSLMTTTGFNELSSLTFHFFLSSNSFMKWFIRVSNLMLIVKYNYHDLFFDHFAWF